MKSEQADTMRIEVQHPDWLKSASKQAETTFKLIAADGVPEPLVGWFVVTKCLHLLRCVYGSDLETLTSLKDHVMAKELEQIETAAMLEKATECSECGGPVVELECLTCGFRIGGIHEV